MMYEDCKLYGPYLSKEDGRLRIILLYLKTGKKQTISYPKYLMEIHLGRYLEVDETVDHIDGNPLNNDLSNLQIIKRNKHSYRDAYRNNDIEVSCKMCGKKFIIKGSKLSCRNRVDRHQSGYFCSKKCTGKYGRMIQLGKMIHTIEDKIVPSKYQVKSAQKEISEVEAG